jgi:8-oxo-dGTP diphosphatase
LVSWPLDGGAVLHVGAAVLRDGAGRVLLSQRTACRDYPGRWEFPGGKVEAGESVDAALARELAEELGITIGATRPLITVPFAGADRALRLEVREVAAFAGAPQGREGQALQWCDPQQLDTVSMPPADLPVIAALTQPALYAISPEPGDDEDEFLRGIDRLLARGVRRLQLRCKTATAARHARLATAVAARARLAGAELLLNGDIDIAEALGCGLHLTSAQLCNVAQRPAVARLAASCHDAGDLVRAERLRCDFVVLGPVAPTASHPHAEPLGWAAFEALRSHTVLPVYALGGMTPADLPIARAHGAQGIAAIRGLWPAARTAAAPRRVR